MINEFKCLSCNFFVCYTCTVLMPIFSIAIDILFYFIFVCISMTRFFPVLCLHFIIFVAFISMTSFFPVLCLHFIFLSSSFQFFILSLLPARILRCIRFILAVFPSSIISTWILRFIRLILVLSFFQVP